MKFNKKPLLAGLFFALLLLVGLTVSSLQKPQNNRSRAATGSTTLSFIPSSSTSNPIQKQIGDTIDLDIMVDPGTNLVSLVKFQLAFDSSKLELSATNPFTLNTAAFPVKVEGPIVNSESIAETVSVGADPTKIVQKLAKVGTVHFKAKNGTGSTPTKITFTSITQVLSVGSGDNWRESVLASTTPATIIIGASPSQASTTPGATITPRLTGTAGTTATFTLLLHGVGSSGDNPNPRGSSLSNKAPLHPQRTIKVSLFDTKNNAVSTISGAVNYDSSSGTFKGSVNLGSNFTQGNYSIKVKTDRYLRKLIPGSQKITPLKNNTITQVALVAGDTNGDNFVNIIDYNAFLDCGYGLLNPLPMEDANSKFNKQICQIHAPAEHIDINDNGIIDSVDYNLFLRELSVLNGD